MIIFLIDRKFTHDTLSIHVIFPILMNCFDPLQFSLEKMCHIRVLGIIVFSTFVPSLFCCFIYNILTTLSVRHGLAVAMIVGEIILSLMLSLHECDHAPQCIHTRSIIHNPSHIHMYTIQLH